MATEYPHLTNAPIVEAIIDIQIQESDVLIESDVLNVKMDRYSDAQEIVRHEVGFQFENETRKTTEKRASHGVRYVNERAGYVLQYRKNGYTLSKLAPYESWEPFLAEAQLHWDEYKNLAKAGVENVKRVAVRYINRLNVPLPEDAKVRIQDYILNAPLNPDEEKRPEITEYLSRIVIPLHDLGGQAILISTMEDPVFNKGRRTLPLILDIDVYKPITEPRLRSDELMWAFFGQMRGIKNELFYDTFSDPARELCK